MCNEIPKQRMFVLVDPRPATQYMERLPLMKDFIDKLNGDFNYHNLHIINSYSNQNFHILTPEQSLQKCIDFLRVSMQKQETMSFSRKIYRAVEKITHWDNVKGSVSIKKPIPIYHSVGPRITYRLPWMFGVRIERLMLFSIPRQ